METLSPRAAPGKMLMASDGYGGTGFRQIVGNYPTWRRHSSGKMSETTQKPLKMADVFWVELLIYQSHREIIGTSSVLGRPPWDAMGVCFAPMARWDI